MSIFKLKNKESKVPLNNSIGYRYFSWVPCQLHSQPKRTFWRVPQDLVIIPPYTSSSSIFNLPRYIRGSVYFILQVADTHQQHWLTNSLRLKLFRTSREESLFLRERRWSEGWWWYVLLSESWGSYQLFLVLLLRLQRLR